VAYLHFMSAWQLIAGVRRTQVLVTGGRTMIRRAAAAGVLVASLTSCMVARYEEVALDKRRLSSGLEVSILWPEAAETTPTVFVDYISSRPSDVEIEAGEVWREIRPEVDRRDVRRVALRATVVEKGFKWRDGMPSFWRTSTSTYWYGRNQEGHWTAGDPGASSQVAPPNKQMQRTRHG
jgi:hypothetical protein